MMLKLLDSLDRSRRQDGFTLLEMAVAGGIFALAITVLAGVLAGGMRGLLTSRQRSSATAEASRTLETARSLMFDNVGLASDDTSLDTDPAITTVSATSRTFNGEPIVFATDTSAHPFKPHVQTIQQHPTTLTRSVYVTGVDTNGDGAPDVKRVTAVVSWARAQGGVSNQVATSTLLSPNSPGTPGNVPVGTCSGPGCVGASSCTGAGCESFCPLDETGCATSTSGPGGTSSCPDTGTGCTTNSTGGGTSVCAGAGCEASCTGPSCTDTGVTAGCSTDGCTTTTEGPTGTTTCTDSTCDTACSGPGCVSTCAGPACSTVCSGPGCETTCPGGCPTPTPPPGGCVGAFCTPCVGAGCGDECVGAACHPSVGPYSGYAETFAGRAVAEAKLGLGSDLDLTSGPSVSRASLAGVNGSGSNSLNITSKVSCREQFTTVGGKAAGFDRKTSALSASSSADSAHPNPSPNPVTNNQAENPAGFVPAVFGVAGDTSSTLLQSTVSCDTSGLAAGASLPYEHGTATSSGAKLTINTDSVPSAVGSLGAIRLFEMRGLVANQSTDQTNPGAVVLRSSATSGLSELSVMRPDAASAVPDLGIGASQGLVHVGAFQATATAATDGSHPTVSGTPYTLSFWNNGVAAHCPSGGSQVGLYCTITITVSATPPSIPTIDEDVCVGVSALGVCLTRVRVTLKITPGSQSVSDPLTLADGRTRVWRADYRPLTVEARIRAYNLGSSNLFDMRVKGDLARTLACAKHGTAEGGCA